MHDWHHLFFQKGEPKLQTMKKAMMVLLILGAVVSVHAQSSKDEARRVILGQPKKSSQQQTRTVILGRNGQTNQTRTVYGTNHNHYNKSNPGKHLGWYKGVGNPHKYGGNPGKGKKKG